jgi:cytosine permease
MTNHHVEIVDIAALENQYEHEPVPISKRKGLVSISAVWFGMPMVLTTAIVGGQLTFSLGFVGAISAIGLGSLIMFLYVGLLSYIAGSTGKNFAQTAADAFGRKAVLVPTAILASVVVGWFAFQTGLTGALLSANLGWNAVLFAGVAGLIYTAITFVGIKALAIVGYISAPLFLLLGIGSIVVAAVNGHLANVGSYAGAGGLGFGAAVTVVIALFADAGTMTADFTRFSKNGRDAVWAAFSAFPVAYFLAMLVGAVVVAGGLAVDPAANGGSFIPILIASGPVAAIIAVIFIFLNLGSVCAHCLYNGAMGWSHISGRRLRSTIVVLGLVGLITAVVGVWSLFAEWLNLLGIIVPPIGAVVIVSFLMNRHRVSGIVPAVRWQGFAAWILASAAAFAMHLLVPQFGDAIVGLVVAALLTWAFESVNTAPPVSTDPEPVLLTVES